MVEKAFLNTDSYRDISSIMTFIDSKGYQIRITDREDNDIMLHSIINEDENNLYKLNTLVEHITNLRDRYLFLMENKKKIEKKYKTQKKAQETLDSLKEKDNLFFEEYKVQTFGNKKETYYSIVCKNLTYR